MIDGNGNYIESSSLHAGFGVPYDVETSEIKHNPSTVIYIGMFLDVWGHCLTDNMKMLWFLKTEIYKKNYKDCPIIYVPLGDFKFGYNHRQFLEILGFDCEKFIPVKEPVQFDKIIYPDECFYTPDGGVRYFTSEYREMINCIRQYGIEHSIPTSDNKIYFSYAGYKSQKQIGERRIQNYLKQRGYKIVSPEQLTFKEQLNILVNCKSFVSTIGSCSHNMIFLNDDTDVVLIPRANYLTGYQLALDEVHNLRVTYIDSTLSIFAAKHPWEGPFYYFISDRLMAYFGDDSKQDANYWLKEFKDFKTYIKYGLLYGQGANPDAYRYYSEIAAECLDKYLKANKMARYKRIILRTWIVFKQRFGFF